jgi:hypothetical protein
LAFLGLLHDYCFSNKIGSVTNALIFTGPFSIPVVILKLIINVVSQPVEIIFNASLSTGIVPTSLKLAKVIPVFKKGLQTA